MASNYNQGCPHTTTSSPLPSRHLKPSFKTICEENKIFQVNDGFCDGSLLVKLLWKMNNKK